MPLEEQYSGDDAWQAICALFREDIWQQFAGREMLIEELAGHEDLAMVASGSMCDPLGWVHKKVPALDNLTPVECAKTESGIKRLRECLMRMHG